jgi:acyl carrier protein
LNATEGSTLVMDSNGVLDVLKSILVERLRFEPARAADTGFETTLPKGVDGSLGLDSLDFIELSVAIEESFGFAMDDPEDLAPHFESFATLTRYITSRMARA